MRQPFRSHHFRLSGLWAGWLAVAATRGLWMRCRSSSRHAQQSHNRAAPSATTHKSPLTHVDQMWHRGGVCSSACSFIARQTTPACADASISHEMSPHLLDGRAGRKHASRGQRLLALRIRCRSACSLMWVCCEHCCPRCLASMDICGARRRCSGQRDMRDVCVVRAIAGCDEARWSTVQFDLSSHNIYRRLASAGQPARSRQEGDKKRYR